MEHNNPTTTPNPMTAPPIPGFRKVPRTGVIYVMTEAVKAGYAPDKPEWANLGQGAPEIGPLPDAPARINTFTGTSSDAEYAPVDGLPALRDAVATLYNARYRKGKASQYTRENVAISAGGRLALTRLVSTLGNIHVGHFLPDYTAYEELLGSFATFTPIPILLNSKRQYEFDTQSLRDEILGRGLSAVLLSNPCNPTGKTISGDVLDSWVREARKLQCTLILDEFYSHYIYKPGHTTVSAARHVEDVNRDPVVILDGLTKNWRYPGWRVSWTVGPKSIIEAIGSAGSFLDGGCARPMQQTALQLVTLEAANREAAAIKRTFSGKRDRMLKGLNALGISVNLPPEGGFYCWGDLSQLPPGLNTGMDLFRAGLRHNVIVVPGEFFDIDPGKRRPNRPSRFAQFARFSFGPSASVIDQGLKNLAALIREQR